MELNYNAEEVANYDFLQAWKTNDPEWMKTRKKEWLQIKNKFDQFPEGFKKKNLKFVRSYFLTGLIDGDWSNDQIALAMRTYNQPRSVVPYVGTRSGLLVSFWLSPDHSQENWERIKCVYCYSLSKRESTVAPVDFRSYHDTCVHFRDTARLYDNVETTYEKRHHYAKFTSHRDSDSIFGETLDKFFFKELKIVIREDGRLLNNSSIATLQLGRLASVLQGYLSGTNFNPNNPIKYFIKEYVKWGLPQSKHVDFYWGTESKVVTFCWHVLNTPKGRHPMQLSVAQELKEEILKVKDTLSEEVQEIIDQGISIFESGNIEDYFLKEEPGILNEPYYKFINENLGITFW